MTSPKLLKKHQDFLDIIFRAAFSNPFSQERREIDYKLTGCGPDSTMEERYFRLRDNVTARVQEFADAEAANIHLYAGETQEKIRTLFLFEVFYRFLEDFDRLLHEQIEQRDSSCRVIFAVDAINRLTHRGFALEESLHYFALFYQMRRAYFFIDRSLIGRGPSMQQFRRHLWNNVFTHDIRWYEAHLWNRMEDFSTLLLGDTGTGKGMAAAAIGRSGYIPFDPKKSSFIESFTRNFISINLSQFSETLIQSELFGHKKGAFTGAIDNHDGLFARCSPHGAVFLDEIGEVSIPVQIMLLKILQERTFTPIGSHEQRRFSGRVIAATNRPLSELRASGRFRDDFFYRLCSDIIEVPPLRQRLQEDSHELTDLIQHIVRRIIGHETPEIAALVEKTIRQEIRPDYPWPGNVREMEQAVRRILLTKSYQSVNIQTGDEAPDALWSKFDNGELSAQAVLSEYCQHLYERFGSYEEVARRANLDRRTAKKYIDAGQS